MDFDVWNGSLWQRGKGQPLSAKENADVDYCVCLGEYITNERLVWLIDASPLYPVRPTQFFLIPHANGNSNTFPNHKKTTVNTMCLMTDSIQSPPRRFGLPLLYPCRHCQCPHRRRRTRASLVWDGTKRCRGRHHIPGTTLIIIFH